MMITDPVIALSSLKSALARRDRNASNEAIRSLLALSPPLGNQWKSIAAVAKQNGEVRDALAAMAKYVGQQPKSHSHLFELAAIRAQLGSLEEALQIVEKLPDGFPNEESNAYIRGTIASNLGQFELARTQLRRAIKANPRSGQAWLALAMIGRISDDDADAMDQAANGMYDAAPIERATYYYALGKLLDERGDFSHAFLNIEMGAAIMQALRRYDAKLDEASAAAAMEGWSAKSPFRGSRAGVSAIQSRPIFVTGLPRSGTTLVEQILAAHSTVNGGEELGLFRLLEQDIGGKTRDHFDAYEARSGCHNLRELYEHLVAQRYPGVGKVIDKTLNLSRYAGMVASVLPDAPIIWLRRDPLDCAWSAYRTWFLRGINWSWSLLDIAGHFKLEDRLFAFWKEQLGDRILEVDYTELVTDSIGQIGRILDHCDLAHEPKCFSPHESERKVITASVAQVREPINLKGLHSASNYEAQLKPFIEAYFC